MKRFDSATCPNCQTLFDRLPVERDETSAYVVFPVHACGECGALLCDCCPQFECDYCCAPHCESHLQLIPDGTPKPLRCCAACAAEIAAEVEPLPFPRPAAIPAQPELRPYLVAAAGKVVA